MAIGFNCTGCSLSDQHILSPINPKYTQSVLIRNDAKGVSSKPSGKHIVAIFFVFELEASNFSYVFAYFAIFLNCAKFQQDWTNLILDSF